MGGEMGPTSRFRPTRRPWSSFRNLKCSSAGTTLMWYSSSSVVGPSPTPPPAPPTPPLPPPTLELEAIGGEGGEVSRFPSEGGFGRRSDGREEERKGRPTPPGRNLARRGTFAHRPRKFIYTA